MLNTYLLLCFKALRKPPVNLSLCTIARSKRDFLRGVRCTIYIREVFFSRHILRDRRPGKTASPAVWAVGTNELKQCWVREKKFVEGQLYEQPRQNKNLLNWHDEPTIQPRRDPVHLYSLSPHLPQFLQSEGATLL
jgi:hypothetical protein